MARLTVRRSFHDAAFLAIGGILVVAGMRETSRSGEPVQEPALRKVTFEFAVSYLFMALIVLAMGIWCCALPIGLDEEFARMDEKGGMMNLTRVLEPEVMDTPEEARDYDAMDHAAVNAVFVKDLLQAGLPGYNVLDLGTGTALIPIELCRHQNSVRVVAVDAAANMLELAKRNLEQAGLDARIQLRQVDAKQLPFADGMFDAVVSNSIIHHIPDPVICLREAIRVVRPGGLLFFRDLLRPASRQVLEQLVAAYAGNESPHARQMFAESLQAALTLEEIRQLVAAEGFEALSVQQTSDRHWTWSAIKGL